MSRVVALAGQLIVYTLTAVILGYFATSPAYTPFSEDKAQIMLSFSHLGQRKEACRKLTQQEIAELAANMRRGEICPRERLPVFVELEVSGDLLYRAELQPTGLARDGGSQAYQKFVVPPGTHKIVARLRDSAADFGFDYEKSDEIALAAGERFVIDFRSEFGGFVFGAGKNAD